ncbi:MAG TPA: response regulator [Syntrophomonas sp.]|jgi:two-component system response regulator (stage 0 sporulation protein F)|nr:response regulator [Syntrophomonas sp.]
MSGKILIVDDQKGVRRLLEELFKKEGWDVKVASDGQEAINKVEERLPDIILMDVKMPNMNGLEASQIILQLHGHIPIIMMTAYGEIEVVKKALDAGVKKCITKPFDIINLRDMVNNLIKEQIA